MSTHSVLGGAGKCQQEYLDEYVKDYPDKELKIINAAINSFPEKGFKSTTTSEIASHAGVAEGTIFRYFPTKDVNEKRRGRRPDNASDDRFIFPGIRRYIPRPAYNAWVYGAFPHPQYTGAEKIQEHITNSNLCAGMKKLGTYFFPAQIDDKLRTLRVLLYSQDIIKTKAAEKSQIQGVLSIATTM